MTPAASKSLGLIQHFLLHRHKSITINDPPSKSSQLTLALVFGVPGVTVPPGISTAAAITPPPLILVCDLNDVTDSWKNN